MSNQMSANVDVECRQGSLQMWWKCRKYIDYHEIKSPKNPESYVEKCRIICSHTHTHIHSQKGSFFKHFHEKKCEKLGTDSKKCQCRLEDLQMSNICRCRWFLQMSTRYGRHLYTPLSTAHRVHHSRLKLVVGRALIAPVTIITYWVDL